MVKLVYILTAVGMKDLLKHGETMHTSTIH